MADVRVGLSEISSKRYKVTCNPERTNLDGKLGSSITWKPDPGTLFLFKEDIEFMDADGMFDVRLNLDGTITATTTREESVEHVYVYWLTLRREGMEFAVTVDPEVDNPPPPPG
jgi:hypothetical protein